ncbi:antitoxin MazE family protein [Plastoroseomonas arctica]|uniref:Antitoxin MazE family protein n=1 Tax=Plastoroseomonas arctica TaxID=1509237 RepID=A0AAF1K008_9PROT|nr:antitoxin MazE family protein [Plastoroseomonas arctica]MBR0654678.1 antitoxin MazE family protein [Plastoroseomonas arctica]
MSGSNTSRRVAAHRAELRKRGLRPIQIWVPDTRAPGFAEEARRQSRIVAAEPDHDEVMDFLERVSIADEDIDDIPDTRAPR